jgi:inorganic pyrophosphatase
MDDLVERFKHRKKMESKLLKIGYCKSVLKDEIQAYLSTYKKVFFNKKILSKKWKIPKEFKKVFKERNKRQLEATKIASQNVQN